MDTKRIKEWDNVCYTAFTEALSNINGKTIGDQGTGGPVKKVLYLDVLGARF